MGTERYYVCEVCQTKTWISTLFDSLHDHANGRGHICECCSSPKNIELTFNFGLDAGPHRCKVLATFLPDQIARWPNEKGSTVEFYPFLVVVESIEEGHSSVWLPYWHIVKHQNGTIQKKYGQWAPFIESGAYSSLVAKAQKAGFLL